MKTWVVAETGLTGTLNQCLGVADALGCPYDVKTVQLRQPWAMLSPYLGFEQAWSFMPSLQPSWPDVVIAAGRKAIAACRYIKRHNPQTYCVFLQDPKSNYDVFDLIAAPMHDIVRRDNAMATVGAPNRITPESLEAINTELFDTFPAPRVAVLLGGDSKTHRMTDKDMQRLRDQMKGLQASFLITPSRRTQARHVDMLGQAGLNVYIWDGQGDNPYHTMLAAADFILVTGDSVSMISDAGSTGKPVYIVPMAGGSAKFDRFYTALYEKNIARPFKGVLESWNYASLNDAHAVASEIQKRMSVK